MAKKNHQENPEVVVNNISLESMMIPNKTTLYHLAAVSGVKYHSIRRVGKKPVAGQVFDPEAINYAELEAYFAKAGLDYTTWDFTAVEGKTSAIAHDMSAYPNGTKVYFRKSPAVAHIVVLQTATHIVVQQEDTTEPQALKHTTFLLYGPSLTPRAFEEVAAK